MATLPQFVPADTLQDLEYPQREAALFYGLFLRGHSADQLRRDIEVPSSVLAKWHREAERDPQLKDVFERMVDYRRHVLAIFDAVGDTAEVLILGRTVAGEVTRVGATVARNTITSLDPADLADRRVVKVVVRLADPVPAARLVNMQVEVAIRKRATAGAAR